MIEPEEQDRWSALAEELGLPPASTQTPPAPGASEAQEPDAAEPGEASGTPFVVEEPPERGRRKRSALPTEEKTEEASEAVPTEEIEAPADEERPRRRRRVRGNKKSRKTAAAESADTAETEETGDEERPRRRRRRRGKKAEKEGEAAPAADMEEEKLEPTSAEEPVLDEEEDEESADFSTWNVPSWAEIIAGLYRPEH